MIRRDGFMLIINSRVNNMLTALIFLTVICGLAMIPTSIQKTDRNKFSIRGGQLRSLDCIQPFALKSPEFGSSITKLESIISSDNIDRYSYEIAQAKWANMLANHPYSQREIKNEEEWRNIPKADRPDLAYEFEYLRTMDPALGTVPDERLIIASAQMEEFFSEKAAIAGVSWTERGPDNVGGRTRSIMFDPNDATHKKVWAGGVGGGLWYTNDITAATPVWSKVNDFWDNIAITAMAYNPANTQEFYVGTGEGYGANGSQRGSGIWKSTDGGATWTRLVSTDPGAYNSASHFHFIQKIVVKSNGYVFASTRGYFSNTSGIMRSIDGGTTWSRVLNLYTGVGTPYDRGADIEIAANGDLFCSFGLNAPSKVYKSIDANHGATGTWVDLTPSMSPTGNEKRIELACAPSDANVVYAVCSGGSGDNDIEWFKKSTDGGSTWTNLTIPLMVDGTGDHFTRSQAWYNLILAVHPTNANLVIVGGVDLHRTLDGGSTWSGISHWYGGFSKPEVHADQHSIVFRPGFSNELLFGNDGGIYYSTDAGNLAATPTFITKNTGYNITQFYACATKNEVNSHYFLAGAQDNGSQQFTLPQMNSTDEVSGGDGAFCHIDQLNSNIQLTAYTNNTVYRSLDGGASFPQLFSNATGHFINPSDYDSQRKILYCASGDNLLKRVSGIDATITNTDLAVTIGSAGSAQVSTLKVSPYNDVVIFGVENGRVYKFASASTGTPVLTRIDNGTTPITATGWVNSIEIGADDNQILVTYSNYGVISVWETTDGGTNWYSKEGNLPDMPIRCAIYNPDNRNQVLMATELGVWSTDNFQPGTAAAPIYGPCNTGLAHTRCDMLKYRAADKVVVVATHGRGLYTTDIFATSSVADFTATPNQTCSGSLDVQFIDGSLKPNGSWEWDVDNNGTIDYTTQNPSHTYSSPGLYAVKLTINSGAATITKDNLILVQNSEPTVCTGCSFSGNSNPSNTAGIGIYRFALGSIDNSTSHNNAEYNNYCCSHWTPLELNTMYNVTVRTGTANNEAANVYIDYNDNGSFEAGELVVAFPANKDGTRTLSFTTPPSGVVLDKGLRLRVVSKFSSAPTTACNTGTYGQAEDYTVYFKNNSPLPVSLMAFTATCFPNGISIDWSTASETNNSYFTLERSIDCEDWETISFIPGAGNSNQIFHYQIIDNIGFNAYYRLRQTDFDGKESLSHVISANCSSAMQVRVYPNPANDFIVFTGIDGHAELAIAGSHGVILLKAYCEDGFKVDVSGFSEGIYFFTLSQNGQMISGSFCISE